ncbi:MAG: ABC transporter transmembrane domain-containing protein, partial [Mycoplasma sp.]
SEFAGTSDSNMGDLTDEEKMAFMESFLETVSEMVNKFLYIGIGMFLSYFLMTSMWQFAGLRQMHHLKEKYFLLIWTQEQGWFDSNNAYEFATKVQAQLEQIEWGLGEKPGQLIQCCAQFISGIIVAMVTSWKLTLVMLCICPCIIVCFLFWVTSMKKAVVWSRKTYELAGGIAEELWYNIKTVASFVNFDYENERFGKYIDKVHGYEVEKALKLGGSIGGVLFFLYFSFVIAILYGKTWIINGETNSNTGEPFQSGDVMTVLFASIMAIMSLGTVAPFVKVIQDACMASSDYFTLYERVPQIDWTNSTFKPPRDEVKGKIEFKNISFIYPSDVNKRKILNELDLLFEPGKKVALVGESGCGKSTTVNLIERWYEAAEGQVWIDDVEIQKYDINYLRTLI